MAEQNAQENTLLSVLEHLKSGNEETKSSAKETKEVAKEVRKQRSDVGKHHNWNKKHGAEQSKVGIWMVGYFGWAKKPAERAAKAAKIDFLFAKYGYKIGIKRSKFFINHLAQIKYYI